MSTPLKMVNLYSNKKSTHITQDKQQPVDEPTFSPQHQLQFKIDQGKFNYYPKIGNTMKKIMVLLALLLTQNSYALKLEGINGIEILAINGEKVKSGAFSLKNEFEVKPGYHQIVLWYSKDFDDEDKSARSIPVILNLELKEDTQIAVPNYNRLYKAERAIKKGLTFQIISANKQYDLTDIPALTTEGFSIFSDIERLIETYNKKNNITIVTVDEENLPHATVVGTITNAPDTVKEQMNLYLQSTPEQKKAFRLWLLEQDMK